MEWLQIACSLTNCLEKEDEVPAVRLAGPLSAAARRRARLVPLDWPLSFDLGRLIILMPFTALVLIHLMVTGTAGAVASGLWVQRVFGRYSGARSRRIRRITIVNCDNYLQWPIKIISYLYECTWAIQKLTRFDKNFPTSDNQFLIKFWLLTFSTMEILNPTVGTVPRKFEKYLWPTNRPAHFIP